MKTLPGLPVSISILATNLLNLLKAIFPMSIPTCLEFGYDMTEQAIACRSSGSLYLWRCSRLIYKGKPMSTVYNCIGEAAYTGLHGANRMASNSLLECIVFGQAASTI